MRELILSIYGFFGIKEKRSINILNHIGWSFFFKAGSMLISFILVPLTLNYLTKSSYGVWLTITSFISWFSFFDIGLGNGLRNKFAEAKAARNKKIAQSYVSTAYFTVAAISLTFIILFLVVNYFVDWAVVFNTPENLGPELSLLLPVMFIFFGMRLTLKLINIIYLADQHHSVNEKILFSIQLLSLIAIWFLIRVGSGSLFLFGIIISAIPIAILLTLNIYSFNTIYKKYVPKISCWRKEQLKDITGLGIKFFMLQIASLVLFSTDNFIISKLFGPEEVVPYNISHKYFSIVIIGYGIIVAPFWSTFTEADAKNDTDWIKKSVYTIQKIWLLIPVLLILMLLASNWFYDFWVGDKVAVPLKLSLSMALYALLLTFNMIYVKYINGVGKVKLQLITSCITMVINIPLSILLGKYLGFGTTGVILATCFSLGYAVILRPIQYYKLINNKAKGIWNK